MKKMPWGIILLLVWVCWITGQNLIQLFSPGDHAGYPILARYGLGPVYIASLIAAVALGAVAVHFFIRPARIGFCIALAWILLGLTQSIVTSAVVFADLDQAKFAYRASRQARGLSDRPELYDAIFTPAGMIGLVGVALVIELGALFL